MPASESLKRAQKKYEAENVKRISLKLNKRTDIDILDFLENQSNKQGFMKRAIRNEIDRLQKQKPTN